MPSATTAESSDSIAARSATANAGLTRSFIFSKESVGISGAGKLAGMPPKREPMVSTCQLKICTRAVAMSMAISAPGILGDSHRKNTTRAMHNPDSPNAVQLSVPRCSA